MNWTTGSCRARGVDLHYIRTGGRKPPLVLLHGLTGSGACWTPLARSLETDFDVVMPDARGHGRSATPSGGYTYEELAADVLAVMRDLHLAPAIVLGHSMGGMTAAVAASRAGPAVRAVVLADPTFLTPERAREVFESDAAEQHRRLLEREECEVLAQLASRHPHRSTEILELIAHARRRTRINAFDVLAPPIPDYRAVVAAIPVPILLIIADGGVVSLETARALERINPGVRIEMIREAGHGVHYDQPDRFERVVTSFLRTVPGVPIEA
jgi:pimeloyl-ACP methyl ester carboxylesterase